MNEPALGRELHGRVFTDGAWIPSLRSRTIRSQARGSWDRAPSGPFALATRTDNAVRELSLQQGHSPVLTADQLRTRSKAGEIDADAELDAMRVAMLLPVAG